MQLRVELRDHQEYENSLHRDGIITVDNEANVGQLKSQIHKLFSIDNEYQELFYKNTKLGFDDDLLSTHGIKHRETLILMHSMLGNWSEFNSLFDLAQTFIDKKQEHKAKKNVKLAFDELEILETSAFFSAYTKFGAKRREFDEKFASFLDTDEKQIKDAAKHYFSLFFKDDAQNPSIQLSFKPKPNVGAQGGLICTVKRSNDVLGTYYLKTHLGLSSSAPLSHQAVDLRELLIYKLMYLLKIGPAVHFVPNAHCSPFGLYIATEMVVGFQTASTTTVPLFESYKLEMLREIFYLIDLKSNNSNYGLDQSGNLCIVDFQVDSHKKSVRSSLRSCLRSADQIEFYKTCMENWKLLNKLKEADNLISKQKQLLKDRKIYVKASKDYSDYLQKVQGNIQLVNELLQTSH